MKFLKTTLFLSFLTPLVLVISELERITDPQRMYYEIRDFEMIELNDVLLLKDHAILETVDEPFDFTVLFNYEEVLEMETEDKRLPTKEELISFLDNAGFNTDGPFGFVPEEYYQLHLQYPGIIDPILGNDSNGEKVGFWFKENQWGENYLSIEKDELIYNVGRTSKLSKMNVRYIRKQ